MNKQQLNTWLLQDFHPKSQAEPLLMGILNTTPDSFYDGGHYTNIEQAYARAMQMIEDGADIIDIGGESSRPYATPTPLKEELNRVLPIIEKIRKSSDICISIDTYKQEVMQEAVQSGANIINDIYALNKVTNINLIKDLNVPIILMHMQGSPSSMQNNPKYSQGIIEEVNEFFTQKIAYCTSAGISRKNLILDPGFGFGKTIEHNLSMINNAQKFNAHNLPLLLGMSRKSTISKIVNKPASACLGGSLALTAYAVQQGVSIIRAHDVAETKQVLTIHAAMKSRSDVYEQ